MHNKINDQRGNMNNSPNNFNTQEEVELAGKNKRVEAGVVAGLVRKSNRILLSIRSHRFPIDLFPDTLNIEEGRITIITRHFFTSEVHSVDIKDISNVFINMVPFFAQLEIVSRTFEDNEITISALWKRDAILARRILEGLRVFENKKIDTSNFTKEELLTKLEELSTTKIVV